MDELAPSRTALGAAAHRAAHQVLEQGALFGDPLALAILGPEADAAVREAKADPTRRGLRLFVAARSTVAETALASAVRDRDVRQLVVLGAGLDTFAYRNPFRETLHVFEVDHPATQAGKRRRLARFLPKWVGFGDEEARQQRNVGAFPGSSEPGKALGEVSIPLPASLSFVPVDFEREDLLARLCAQGFEPERPSFFTWLGVVPYLTEPAVFATLGMIGGLPGGAEVVFDYSDPPHTLTPELRAAHEARAARVAELGEPFLSYFEPAGLHDRLRALGFGEIEDLNLPKLAARFGFTSGHDLPERGGHVLRARTGTAPAG
jgi:O-methyltransferase involved in polyketide biosynthesis